MGATYFKVMLRERGSDTWTALGVGADGEFAQAYGLGRGLRFFDHGTAAAVMRAAQHYAVRGADIDEWKVSQVREGP